MSSIVVPTAERVAERLTVIRRRIEIAGGDPDTITVLAVTKGFGPDAVLAAAGAGLTAVGENYAQELRSKAEQVAAQAPTVAPTLVWHFIGQLQRNKVKILQPLVGVWQTLDRAALIDEVATRAPGATVLVQANLSGEPHKGGAPLAEVPALVSRARAGGLDVVGLLGVGPAGPPEAARPGFRSLVRLADELGLPVRSIGMSADLEVAVEEGATLVRIGRDLFGPRPPRQ